MRLLLATASALCLGTLLFLLGCNSAAYRNQATANNAPPTKAPGVQTVTPAPQPTDGIRRITVAELKQALDANNAIVIDVRGEAAYKAAHIKGARMIPSAEIDKHVDELPKDKLIVTYCS
jgi:Rhodanese-like domain